VGLPSQLFLRGFLRHLYRQAAATGKTRADILAEWRAAAMDDALSAKALINASAEGVNSGYALLPDWDSLDVLETIEWAEDHIAGTLDEELAAVRPTIRTIRPHFGGVRW
jgi:hypothetical protein